MNILGLHFGSDAGVSVVRKGRIAAHIHRERYTHKKHAISLQFRTIQMALVAAGLRMDQIDYCAITSTQNMELIIDDPTQFSIDFSPHPKHTAPCTLQKIFRENDIDPTTLFSRSLMRIFYEPPMRRSYLFQRYEQSFPEHLNRQPGDFAAFGWIDRYLTHKLWPGATLGQIAATDFSEVIGDDGVRHGFHYPVTVKLGGRAVAGYFVAHHAAHAASSYYQSGFRDAAIFTHDQYGDASGSLTGMFYWGQEGKIFPITPHHLMAGALYEAIGVGLGLGAVDVSAKLMALSAYGKPRLFERAYVGNWFDWIKAGLREFPWGSHLDATARSMGYDMTPLKDPDRMTAPVNADMAASTQKLFEELYLAGADALYKIIGRTGRRTSNLCLSGDAALNYASNSRLLRESKFPNVFIEPGCDDSGIAVGAALFVYHNVLDQKLARRPAGAAASPYLGVPISAARIKTALDAAKEQVEFTPCPDPAKAAAFDLLENNIVGWYEGASESGPYALGHRSILADPRQAENKARVNLLKGREAWRPLAPMVLESEAPKWFYGAPDPSPYRSFSAMSRSNQAPAVAHVDGTAQIQTVSRANGEIGKVVEWFFLKTQMPMVLNASLSGPNQPIVETPKQAIQLLVGSTLDVLYMGEFRIVRRG